MLLNEQFIVLYRERKNLKGKYEKLVEEKRDDFKNIIMDVIREGQKIGQFRKEIPMTITGMSILGMVNWTYQWYKKEGPKTIDQIASTYIDIIFRGILSDKYLSIYESSRLYKQLKF